MKKLDLWTRMAVFTYVQNFKTIGQLLQILWKNEISRDFSLRCVWDEYPILHNTLLYKMESQH